MPPRRPTQPKKPTRPAAKKKPTNKTKATSGTRKTNVRAHRRVTASGKTTKVRRHTRTVTWKQAGAAWAGAGTSGIFALGTMLEAGFSLLGLLFALIAATLAGLAYLIGGDRPARRQASRNSRSSRRRR